MTQSIDVTGLPEPVVASLRELVTKLRDTWPAVSGQTGMTPEEKIQAFKEWVNRPRPPAPSFVDDSRESIYDGRGE